MWPTTNGKILRKPCTIFPQQYMYLRNRQAMQLRRNLDQARVCNVYLACLVSQDFGSKEVGPLFKQKHGQT